MGNFTPLKTGKQNKKINKFLIFGNLFLVVLIAIVGIFYYNNTLLTTQQQAKNANDIKASQEKQKAEDAKAAAQAEKKAAAKAEKKAAKTIESNNGSNCSDGQTFCSVTLSNGKSQGLCISDSASGCNAAAVDAGYSVQTGGGGAGSGGWLCVVGKNGYKDGPCVEYNSIKSIGAGKPPSCFCGIIQIDGGEFDGSYQSNCGCNQEEQTAMQYTALVGTIIPTPTGIPTSTPIPTATPVITNTPTPTAIPTTTSMPTPPATLTPTPTTPPGQPTNTPAPTATNTPGPSATPIPILCGTKSCDNTTNPCRSGYICVQANDGSNYCSSPDFVTACKANPSYNACCIAPGQPTATPTEIILAKVSPTVVKLLQTGMIQSFMYLIPITIMLVGLIL